MVRSKIERGTGSADFVAGVQTPMQVSGTPDSMQHVLLNGPSISKFNEMKTG